ncbi:hypothetical protein IB221_12450 [Pantoea sp. PNT01]|jgi:hypothetical protein|uniref:hypothetical protein n=1 Tax=Pantoea TaxID=53335 RepID=UPI00057C7A4C|nr:MULTISPECIES: hypothetical protein [Pantoea]MBD9553068.1 hypothetical protein [Pantoea sp. PNT01]
MDYMEIEMICRLPGYLVILTLLLILSGCTKVRDISSQKYTYKSDHSLAWNINNASGMTPYYDAQVSPNAKLLFTRTDFDLSFPVVKANGFNEGSVSLTPLMEFVSVGLGPEDWLKDGILAWVPLALASTPAQASQVLSDTLEKAVISTLKETGRSYGDVRKGKSNAFWLAKYVFQDNDGRYLVVKFEDAYAGCEVSTDKYYVSEHQNRPDCTFFTSFHDPEKIVSTPDFINANGTGKSYLIRLDGIKGSYISPVYEKLSSHSKADSLRLSYAFLQQVSRHLPSWVVFHLSPHEDEGLPALILKQGKVHFFVRAR